MKKATKASDNRYYQARFSAAQKNTDFSETCCQIYNQEAGL